MDVNQAYKLTLYAASKNLQNGYVSPEDFNTILMPLGQRSYMDYLLGEYQRYQIKRPIAVVEFGQNERLRDSLSPFIYGVVVPIDASGYGTRPSDYEYVDTMLSVYGNYNIRFVQQPRMDAYIHSAIDPVATNPVYLIEYEGFHYFPARPYGENQAKMFYVRTPPAIVWGYVLDSNGIPVYNPATSQQPVWSDTDMLQVIVRALAIIGVNLQLGALVQYAEQIKQGGQ